MLKFSQALPGMGLQSWAIKCLGKQKHLKGFHLGFEAKTNLAVQTKDHLCTEKTAVFVFALAPSVFEATIGSCSLTFLKLKQSALSKLVFAPHNQMHGPK